MFYLPMPGCPASFLSWGWFAPGVCLRLLGGLVSLTVVSGLGFAVLLRSVRALWRAVLVNKASGERAGGCGE